MLYSFFLALEQSTCTATLTRCALFVQHDQLDLVMLMVARRRVPGRPTVLVISSPCRSAHSPKQLSPYHLTAASSPEQHL